MSLPEVSLPRRFGDVLQPLDSTNAATADAVSGRAGRGSMFRLPDKLYAWRNALLANPRFHSWAASFPLTRPIARSRARDVFTITTGFVYSQVLLACVQLGLFEKLRAGPRSIDQLAVDLDLPRKGAERLLKAADSVGLLELRGPETYGLGRHGAALLGNPGIGKMVAHHAIFYADLMDPVAMLRAQGSRETNLSRYWAYALSEKPGGLAPEATGDYTALMSASQTLVAEEILDAYSLKPHRCLMDVGGGNGTFLIEAAKRAPDLQIKLFDLPSVAERAKANFAQHGLSARATAYGGSFSTESLPRGADIISLVRIVHDHDDDAVKNLLAAARAALPPGGTLLIAEPLAGTPGAEPMGEAYFGFYLMAMGSGRPRTRDELETMLLQAGFARVRHVATRMPLQTSLIAATV